MKSLKHLPIVIAALITSSCFTTDAQVDKEILNELRTNFINTDTYEFLFIEKELIEYCKDSVGQSRFLKRMTDHKKRLSQKSNIAVKTELIMLKVLRDRIASIIVNDQPSRDSKTFLENQLQPFEVNEKLVSDLFDHSKRDKATTEVCDVGVAMYIIFIYNPSLYVKVLEENKVINPDGNVYFPIKCTLKEYDRSVLLRKKMKMGLLEMLGSPKDSSLKKIFNDITNCDVSGSYD